MAGINEASLGVLSKDMCVKTVPVGEDNRQVDTKDSREATQCLVNSDHEPAGDEADAKGFIQGLKQAITGKHKKEKKSEPFKTPATQEMCQSEIQKCDTEYAFSNTRNGFMLTIVNDKFDSSPKSSRPGAEKDPVMMAEIADTFGFDKLIGIRNQTSDETVKNLQLAQSHDFSLCDCFVLMISTHGDECIDANTGLKYHCILCTDRKWLSTRQIIDMFNDKYCPSLKNKPKLFFIQACRGSGTDPGVMVQITTSNAKDDNTSSRQIPERGVQRVDSADAKGAAEREHKGNISTPTEGAKGIESVECGNDMLVMFASPSGMLSWRSHGDGSWMIFYLHQALMATTAPTSLLQLAAIVNGKISKRESDVKKDDKLHEKKTVCVVLHKLKKDIVLKRS